MNEVNRSLANSRLVLTLAASLPFKLARCFCVVIKDLNFKAFSLTSGHSLNLKWQKTALSRSTTVRYLTPLRHIFSGTFLALVLQSKNRLSALSWLDSTSGFPHAPQWNCICKIDGEVMGSGTGPQKHVARDIAANQALKTLIDTNWS
ncbi:hypothetical protein HHX47_DHR1001318 [Lentinula edodes]|nr:hypothetical protein HHX47_DHR1001318 [Lentinula edodes]